jgi:hypothetical protein
MAVVGLIPSKQRKLQMKRSILIASLSLLVLAGCTDGDRAQLEAYGSKFKVTLYSASGTVIQSWTSSGKVHAEQNSDGWYFMRNDNGKLERVSGTVTIDQLD